MGEVITSGLKHNARSEISVRGFEVGGRNEIHSTLEWWYVADYGFMNIRVGGRNQERLCSALLV